MDWLEIFQENINAQKKGLSEKDMRFFHVERLVRVAGHLHHNSETCMDCCKLKEPVFELSGNLQKYIHGSTRDRKYFERIFDMAVSHLRVTHRLFPPFYYNYLYSFIGFFSGLAAGGALYFGFSEVTGIKIILILALAGLVTGQVTGRKKDNLVRTEGRKLL